MTTNLIGTRKSDSEIFWGEMSPSEHVVQIYGDDHVFLDALEGYVSGGIRAGECIIVIMTPEHREGLEARLSQSGFLLDAIRATDQYIALDAEETLAKFMVGEWPDEERFKGLIMGLLTRARSKGRRVRAFGEMVAILWERGNNGATVQLEHMWHQFCEKEAFCLFCAYPRIGFTQDAEESIKEICDAHSKVFPCAHAA